MSSNAPEYLDGPAGPPASARGRRTAWVAGGAVGVIAVVGVGAWAAWSFFSTGPQPARALPASTLAYASVDLDPSGGQKIEALRTLRKFPAFKEHIGLDTDDDLRRAIFEEVRQSGGCAGLDYAGDVEPWLGDRMAVAAVDTGDDEPTGVVVVQVTDEDAADAGLAKLRACGGGSADEGAWAIADGWALVGESQDVVDDIADDAADAPLADDADFQHWTDQAGGDGIMTAYVSPAAGSLLADELDLPEADDALADFGGMAATLRFADGAFELEAAADAGRAEGALGASDRGDDVLATLPDDTAAALGSGFAEDWFGNLVSDDVVRDLADESGLDLPADVETLFGSSAALALGGDFDPDAFFGASDGGDLPVGLKVLGDADAIGAVVDKLDEGLGTDSDGDVVVAGPDDDYRQELLADGRLGDTEAFRHAVPGAQDAGAVLFVNFDAGSWLDRLDEGDEEFADNVEPLEALGVSTRVDDGTSHLVLRLTTD